MPVILLTIVAFLTAVLSAMAGLGGGTILIAVIYALGLSPVVAVPLHATVQLASNGARTVAYLKWVNWPATGIFCLGAIPMPFLIAPWVAVANPDIILLIMAGFILLALWPDWLRKVHMHGPAGLIAAGILAGGAGSIVGASGILIGPFLFRPGWDKETVIATLAMCQSIAHLSKVAAFATIGFAIIQHWQLLTPMLVAVIIGAFTGKALNGKFSETGFRTLFRMTLFLLAVKLGYDGIMGLAGTP